MKKKDYFLVDLRDEDSFKKMHIKGAKNIFWLSVLDDKNLKRLPKNKHIFLICYVGHTSSQVLVLLKLLGYKIHLLSGDHPTEKNNLVHLLGPDTPMLFEQNPNDNRNGIDFWIKSPNSFDSRGYRDRRG